MASIKISDLHPTGSELFSDSESYMAELGNNELEIINGGLFTSPLASYVISRITSRILTRQVSRYLTRTPRP